MLLTISLILVLLYKVAVSLNNMVFKIIIMAVMSAQVEKDMEQVQIKPNVNIRLNDLKLVLGPNLRITYPLILDFAVNGELELNGLAHPKSIKPKGVLAFENGEVGLGATQVCLIPYVVLWLVISFARFMLISCILIVGEVKARAYKHC